MKHPIDEFESMFRAAEREPFAYVEIPLRHATIITDGPPAKAETLKKSLLRFMPRLQRVADWRMLTENDYHNVAELLDRLDQQQTDLVVTFRHLQEKSFVPQHSLGVYLDVLTQAASIPVLVLPGTAAEPVPLDGRICDRVMVVTDHIQGEHALVNYGVRCCGRQPDGHGDLWLCHVEDDLVFQRYMRAIGQIPEIDTEAAREQIDRRLLKDASDFIETCIAELNEHGLPFEFHSHVERGHRLKLYREFVRAARRRFAGRQHQRCRPTRDARDGLFAQRGTHPDGNAAPLRGKEWKIRKISSTSLAFCLMERKKHGGMDAVGCGGFGAS